MCPFSPSFLSPKKEMDREKMRGISEFYGGGKSAPEINVTPKKVRHYLNDLPKVRRFRHLPFVSLNQTQLGTN